jgi:hypothetical protein
MALYARTSGHPETSPPALPGHRDDDHVEQDRRINDLMRQAAEAHTAPPRTRREWLAWGRRHGTEHPEQTWDRVAQQQSEADASRARIDQRYPYQAEDQYDRRTIGNMARRGQESRQLNAHRAGPPRYLAAPDFDYVPSAEQVDGDFYRRGQSGRGIRSLSSDYAWNMRDGW